MVKENDKIEVSKGAALSEQFKNLSTDEQEIVLSNIGLEREEPKSAKERFKALPKDQAQLKYGKHHHLKRAGTYKALNRLIQGSAADQTKQAMINLFKEGMTPLIQIHDELTLSFDGSDETKNKIISVMENAIELSVPSKVDCDLGKSWGEAT